MRGVLRALIVLVAATSFLFPLLTLMQLSRYAVLPCLPLHLPPRWCSSRCHAHKLVYMSD